ncbi:enteropeptidase-like [Hemiscyllium ocellatum]|uniref:enteropeptidase-like n=1 Tax=Hemiscyllium ocellatum TaxID=170820 RepID=UPI0029662B66|nr:enteropeptidase-like [Hemiscyllium ocellatum]
MQGRSSTYTSQHLQTPANSVTPASHVTRFSDTTSLSIVTEDICNFVGELKVKVSSSITLSPDYRSAENTSIAAAVEQKIKQAYRSSTFNTKYISTKIIGISNVYSAIRFMMQFLCSVSNQEKQMTEILQQGLGTVKLSDSEQLTVDLKSTIIWCHDNMLICDNGYCTGKTNAFCDGVKDCWNGSDEEGCDCQASSAGQCPSVVTLTGKRYKFLCHGALVSNKWVLTSARCANQSSFSAICVGSPKPEKYRIAEHHIVDWKGEGIALLHLESEVNFKDFQPITLPDSAGQTETAQTTCRIAIQKNLQTPGSWSVIASNKQTIVLRQNCQKISKCQVATGSPLVCRKENSAWVLTAVRGACSASTMTYRRVNKALALIKKYIN